MAIPGGFGHHGGHGFGHHGGHHGFSHHGGHSFGHHGGHGHGGGFGGGFGHGHGGFGGHGHHGWWSSLWLKLCKVSRIVCMKNETLPQGNKNNKLYNKLLLTINEVLFNFTLLINIF